MLGSKNIASLVEEHKRLFIIITVVFFLLELEIFALAAIKSGRKSYLQVFDANGNMIHETDGRQLSDFNKYYFEKTFGPFEDYEVKLITKEIPFPFRAWFAAAVGIPVGLVLLLGFLLKAFNALFYGANPKTAAAEAAEPEDATRIEKIINRVSRFNIFVIGALVFLAIFAYWVVPNLIQYIGAVGMETITRFKWVFIALAGVILGLFVWIIYLRYLLAKKALNAKTELDKYRLQLEFEHPSKTPLQLEYGCDAQAPKPQVGWEAGEQKR